MAGISTEMGSFARAIGLTWICLLAAPFAAAQNAGPAVDPDTPPAIVRDAGDPVFFALGDTVGVTITFDQAVTVTGSPRIKLDIGGVERYAAFESANGAVLRFTYLVQAGDQDADGLDIVVDSLVLNGGTIRGGTDDDAVLDHATQSATDTRRPVDGVVPTVRLLGGVDGFLSVDSFMTVVVAFSESVSGLTEDDFVISNGTVEDLDVEDFIGLPDSVYSFLVDPDGEGPLTVTLPAGAVQDAAGNGNTASSQVRVLVGDPATAGIVARTSNTAEGQAVEFRVERSKANGERTVQVRVSQHGDYLAGGTSFGATITVTPVTVPISFAAAEKVVTISLDTDDDFLDEANGSVTAALLPDPTEVGYVVGYLDAATAVVRDNDDPLTLAAYAAPAVTRPGIPATEVIEGDPITITLVRSRDAGAQTVDVEIAQTGAYLADSHPDGLTIPENGRIEVAFPAEALAAGFTLNTTGDTEHKDDGSITLTVLDRPDDPGYPSSLGTPATIAVRDNDATPTVTAAAVEDSVTEGSLIRGQRPAHRRTLYKRPQSGGAGRIDGVGNNGAGGVSAAVRRTARRRRQHHDHLLAGVGQPDRGSGRELYRAHPAPGAGRCRQIPGGRAGQRHRRGARRRRPGGVGGRGRRHGYGGRLRAVPPYPHRIDGGEPDRGGRHLRPRQDDER